MTWREPVACWSPEDAIKVIPVEAETPSDAVFLATHSSIPIFQRDVVTNYKRTSRIDEEALLKAVLEQPADQPVLPILGRSGTGKSHLVRWLRARIPETETRRVIFVPKHRMSLRGIIDLILDGVTSERAAELREKIAKAVEGIATEQEAKLRLKNELAVLVEMRGNRTDVPAEEQELRQWLTSSDGLPALLGDSVFRDRLFDDLSPISRLAREKLAGRGAEDKEEAFGFAAGDLAMTVDDTARASAAARDVAAALMDQSLRELAATMLNEQLSAAVSQVFGIGGDDLKELLVEARIELQREKQELLLLIEDFSIFQGIQGGLLDAITLIPTQDNGVCPMRVVLAVTSGYFVKQMPDTVYTRVYQVFDLDDPAPRVSFEPAAVASRYMNAIRVGERDLDAAYDAGDELPNACEQCPVNDACHSAFGAVDGFGLFPFNRAALDKAVGSKLVDNRLSVRDFLTRVLRPVLFNQHDAIERSAFPNTSFDDAFRAGAIGDLDSVEDEHRLATPGDAELSRRRVVLVRYWGESGSGPHNLAPTIHDAFGIPPVDGLAPGDSGVTATPNPTPPPQVPIPTPVPVKKTDAPPLVRAVDTWRGRGQLLQAERNTLRQLVHGAVLARLTLDDGLGGASQWTTAGKEWGVAFDAQSVAFADQATRDALITLDRDHDEDVRALRALAWVDAAGNWRAVENGEELQRVVEERVTGWAREASAALAPSRDARDDPELAVVANTLLVMAKALGIPDAFKDDSLSRTRALFASAPEPLDDSRPKMQFWQGRVTSDAQRLTREQLQQRLLRLASFTQGAGKPLALDLPKVASALRGKDAGADLAHGDGLLGDTAQAVAARLAGLSEVRDEASALVPDLEDLGGEIDGVIRDLDALVAGLARGGRLPSGIVAADLLKAGRDLKPGDAGRVERVRSRLDSWAQLSVDEQLRVLTEGWDESAGRVRRWRTLADQAVRALEASLSGGAASGAQDEFDEARAALVAALHALAALVAPRPDREETA